MYEEDESMEKSVIEVLKKSGFSYIIQAVLERVVA